MPLPPVVVHMLELDRAKRRDTVKSMLKQCSKEDRTRFRYELQRLRQQHVQKKADNARSLAASAPSVSTPPVAAASSSSSSKLERAKTAIGAIDASARLKTSTAAAKTSELRSASAAAPPARPTVRANGVQRDEADVIRRLSVNSSLKRILSGYLDDDDDDDDNVDDLVVAPPSLVPPAGATAQSPRNGASSNGTAASTSPRLSYGGISARTRAPPSIAALEQHSESDSDAPPLPPSSTAPSLDLDELLGV